MQEQQKDIVYAFFRQYLKANNFMSIITPSYDSLDSIFTFPVNPSDTLYEIHLLCFRYMFWQLRIHKKDQEKIVDMYEDEDYINN